MDTINNEFIPLSYDIPYAVDITLYSYNYLDNLIIGHLKKHTQYEPIPNENGFIVTSEDLIFVITKFFNKELQKVQSLTEATLADGVNSIYFLDKILTNFRNLKYFKVNISNSRKFSRVLQLNNKKQVINFDYRIITSVINLTDYFLTEDSLRNVNLFLEELGIINRDIFNNGRPYYILSADEFMTLISQYEEVLIKDEIIEGQFDSTIDILYSLIDQKCEKDNSRLIIITDYIN